MSRQDNDADEFEEQIIRWAREHGYSDGHVAQILTAIANKLLTVDERGSLRMRRKPETGVVCRGAWWPGNVWKYRALRLDDHELIVEGERETKGSINVAEYVAIMEAIKWLDEEGEGVAAIYSASYVAVSWMKQNTFRTSQEVPRWVEIEVADFISTDFRQRGLVRLWDENIWGPTPIDWGGRTYMQKWDVR